MKHPYLVLFSILFLRGAISWSQDSVIQVPFLLNNNIERLPITNIPQIGDTAQIHQLIKSGNRMRDIYPDSAANRFKEALKLSWQLNYNQGIAVALLSLGSYFFNHKENYRQAKAYFNRALPYCQKSDSENKRLVPGVYSSIANVHFLEGKYDSAIQFYYKALAVIKQRPVLDTQQLILSYAGIGAVMGGDMGQNDRALQYLQKGAQWWHMYKKDTSVLATIYTNIGSLHYKKGKIDSALQLYHKALYLYQDMRLKKDIQHMHNYIATIWLYEKNLPKAKTYLDSAVNTDPEGAKSNWHLLQNLGCVYYFSGNFEKAIPYYKKSLELCNVSSYRLNCYSTLAALYDTIGRGHLAYQYHVAYSKLKDTLFNENKIKTINQLEVQYRTVEKDKELAQKQLLIAQQQNKIQQQYLWIGGAVIGILILLGVFYRKRHKAAIAELKAILAGEEKERRRMAAELHDGIVSKLSSVKMNFDALAPAYAYTPEENAEFREALQLLEQSIAELRTTSQNLQPSILKKAGLIPAVAIYCEKINKVASPLLVDFQLVGELPPLNEDFQLNIYRIIQELVNNMVKHSKATRALVQFNAGPRQLTVTVEDNGIGLPPEKLNAENGIGLFNLQKRLKVLNGTMDIATQNGTSIYLEFDLHSFIAKTT